MSVLANIVLQLTHHRPGNRFTSMRPNVEDLVVSLLVCDNSSVIELLLFQHERFCVGNNFPLIGRGYKVARRERQAGLR